MEQGFFPYFSPLKPRCVLWSSVSYSPKDTVIERERDCEIITTISLVNIYHLTKLQSFFLVMRMFKIYSFSNFQISNTILLTIVIMPYITSPALICLITGSEYLLTPFTHLFHLPTLPWQPSSCPLLLSLVFTDSTYK